MKSVSANALSEDARRRWAKKRREMYRAVLRDPRSTPTQKATATQKLESVSPRK